MSYVQSDSNSSSYQESNVSKLDTSETRTVSCSKCNSSKSTDSCNCKSSFSFNWSDIYSKSLINNKKSKGCDSKSAECSSCGSSSSFSCSCDFQSLTNSCSRCSSGRGTCISSGNFSLSNFDSCSFDNDSELSNDCKSFKCTCSSSAFISSGQVSNSKGITYDLATAAISFIPTDKALECADFVGSRVVGRGYIYEGHSICDCELKPFRERGIECGKPQYPKKIVGTYDLEYTIINPEFNRVLGCLFSNYFCKYFELSNRLRGKVIANATLTLNFSGAPDFFILSSNTLVLSGRIPWGIKGEEWTMAVTGGTGDYDRAKGEVEFERLNVTNGSKSRLGESWRISLFPGTFPDSTN